MAEPSEKKTIENDVPAKSSKWNIARLVSLSIILLGIIILGVTFIRVLAPFLLPLFLAGVVAILCQPMYGYFMKKVGGRRSIAAGLTTTSFVAMIVIPLAVGIFIGSLQLYTIINTDLEKTSWVETIDNLKENFEGRSIAIQLQKISPPAGLTPDMTDEERDALFEEDLEIREEQIRDGLQSALQRILQSTLSPGTALSTVGIITSLGSIIMAQAIFIFALYYFLADGPSLIEATESLIPVNVDHLRKMFSEFAIAVRAVVMATMFAALGQGFATSIGLYFFGFGHFFIFTIVAILCALIPFVGTTLVWGPCAIYLMVQGDWVTGIALLFYGGIVVGTLDNVIRTYVLNSDIKLHPLLAFVSIMGACK